MSYSINFISGEDFFIPKKITKDEKCLKKMHKRIRYKRKMS